MLVRYTDLYNADDFTWDKRTPSICRSSHNNIREETWLSLTNRATHFGKCNVVGDPIKDVPPHMCYHAEFRCSATSKGVDISGGEPSKLDSAGVPPLGIRCVVDPYRNSPVPVCYTDEFVCSTLNGLSTNTQIRLTNLTSRVPAFQGHPRSGHRNRHVSISYL